MQRVKEQLSATLYLYRVAASGKGLGAKGVGPPISSVRYPSIGGEGHRGPGGLVHSRKKRNGAPA